MLGLCFLSFLVLNTLSRGWIAFSVLGAIVITYSPFFQFWCFHKTEVAIFGLLCFQAAVWIFSSKTTRGIWMGGVVFGWSLAAFALSHIYPPHQVVVASLILLLFLGVWLDRRVEWESSRFLRTRICASVAGLGITAAALGIFYAGAGGAIALLNQTEYPGRRFSTGGEIPLKFIRSSYSMLFSGKTELGWLGNQCESAYGFFVFPVLLIALWRNKAFRAQRATWCVLGFIAFAVLYTSFGVPSWVAHVTFWGKTTAGRTGMGLVLADVLLLGVYAGVHRGKRLLPLVAILAGVSVWFTYSFNPMTRGGTRFLLEHPLSQRIQSLNTNHPGRWMVFGETYLFQLPRILGVESLGGYHPQPDLALWNVFDPEETHRTTWNQAAFVSFVGPTASEHFIRSPSPGTLVVAVSPEDPRLKALNVRYFIAAPNERALFVGNPKFKAHGQFADWSVFERL